MGKFTHFSTGFSCPSCSKTLNVSVQYMLEYFEGKETRCPNCGQAFDWWQTVLDVIREDREPMQTLASIGANWTIIMVKATPNKAFQVDLTEHGIPEDARVLDISGQLFRDQYIGGIIPLEMHTNIRPRHIIPSKITIYPASLEESQLIEKDIPLFVTWGSKLFDDYAWQSLIDAFHAYVSRNYVATIVPANVAIESILGRVMTAFFEPLVARDRLKSFLQDGATYSHQLNVLLPALLSLTNIHNLPDNIRGKLNRLRDLRNEIAHKGHVKNFGKEEAAECLTAALFGFDYFKFVAPNLIARANVMSVLSAEASQDYSRNIGTYIREDYHKAGSPYGDTDEGLHKWVEELIRANGRGASEFGAI